MVRSCIAVLLFLCLYRVCCASFCYLFVLCLMYDVCCLCVVFLCACFSDL